MNHVFIRDEGDERGGQLPHIRDQHALVEAIETLVACRATKHVDHAGVVRVVILIQGGVGTGEREETWRRVRSTW